MKTLLCFLFCFSGVVLGFAAIGVIFSRHFVVGLLLLTGAMALVYVFGNPWSEDKDK